MRSPLVACPSCACHVQRAETVCPHCGESIARGPTGVPLTKGAALLGLAVSLASPALVACGDDGSGGNGGSAEGGGAEGGGAEGGAADGGAPVSGGGGEGGAVQSDYGAAPSR
ncbi:MAG: hypothetical protein HOW73_05910 [Polyangiaceae bacterium]|nr:hypothetical protein [Polyangiaceae bacterium]